MTASPNFTLTIEFTDPELDPEDRNKEAQLLMRVLDGMDEIETVDRVIDPTPAPDGTRSLSVTYLVGLLMAQMNIDNAKKMFEFLRVSLVGKPIKLVFEFAGEKISIEANSQKDFDHVIQCLQDLRARH
jgi:hypothetical protein